MEWRRRTGCRNERPWIVSWCGCIHGRPKSAHYGEPGKMGGKPLRGLRFTVYDLASGMTEEEILRDFPYLEKEDFQAVYEFFASIPERIAVLEASRWREPC